MQAIGKHCVVCPFWLIIRLQSVMKSCQVWVGDGGEYLMITYI